MKIVIKIGGSISINENGPIEAYFRKLLPANPAEVLTPTPRTAQADQRRKVRHSDILAVS